MCAGWRCSHSVCVRATPSAKNSHRWPAATAARATVAPLHLRTQVLHRCLCCCKPRCNPLTSHDVVRRSEPGWADAHDACGPHGAGAGHRRRACHSCAVPGVIPALCAGGCSVVATGVPLILGSPRVRRWRAHDSRARSTRGAPPPTARRLEDVCAAVVGQCSAACLHMRCLACHGIAPH